MSPKESRELIEQVGGGLAFARLLGIDRKKSIIQRVCNWKRRGIPAAIEIEHYQKIQEIRVAIDDGLYEPSNVTAA